MKNRSIRQEKIRELEKQVKRLKSEKQILEIAISVAEDELGIPIRKKYLAKLSSKQKQNKGKLSGKQSKQIVWHK